MGRLGDVSMAHNAGDFRLVDRRALDCFLAMPERDRFVRGMFAWIGFRQATVTFDRPPRAAGISKYSLPKMVGLAANGLISFSDAPLRLALWAGATVSALAFVYGLSVIGRWMFGDLSLERGWSSTIVVIAALGGANMLMTGVIGLYVGRVAPRRRAGRSLSSSAPWALRGEDRRSTAGGDAELKRPATIGQARGHARSHCQRARFALYPGRRAPTGR